MCLSRTRRVTSASELSLPGASTICSVKKVTISIRGVTCSQTHAKIPRCTTQLWLVERTDEPYYATAKRPVYESNGSLSQAG
jgi:hypothetical protein